jgi:heat shock protein HtpX
MFKRVGLFLLTNILIMVTITFVINIFGLNQYLNAYGINYTALMGFCLVWGFAGSFISLLLSKTIAKMAMGVQEIDGRGHYAALYNTVQRLSKAAGIPMPEVGIYDSPEINAFATGASKGNALVAVSTGLLDKMESGEVDGVLAHEISHVANGDMVTMTLIQGLVNSFGMFLARIIGFAIGIALGRSDDRGVSPNYFIQMIVIFVLDILFSILGSFVVAYFSRQREFRADFGGAKLAGKQNMISALENLRRNYGTVVDDRGASIASLKISGRGWFALLATHPPLEDRIAALKRASLR